VDSSRVLAKNSQINGIQSHLEGLSALWTTAADPAVTGLERARTLFNWIPSMARSAQTKVECGAKRMMPEKALLAYLRYAVSFGLD
jgi:hypothetical protein